MTGHKVKVMVFPPKECSASTIRSKCSRCEKPLVNIVKEDANDNVVIDGTKEVVHIVCQLECFMHKECFHPSEDGPRAKCPHCRETLPKPGDRSLLVAGATIGGIIAGAVLMPIAAPAVLGVVGFGSTGVVGGTIAAAWQSTIGSVIAGSLFATCQSVAMGGALPVAWTVVGATAGGITAGVSKIAKTK